MHGSNTLPALRLSIVESIPGNTLRRVPGNELDRLHNTVDNLETIRMSCVVTREIPYAYLMLNTRVFSLSVFTDENRVDIVVGCLETLDGDAGPHVGEQVECPTEGKIEGYMTLANCNIHISI